MDDYHGGRHLLVGRLQDTDVQSLGEMLAVLLPRLQHYELEVMGLLAGVGVANAGSACGLSTFT